MTRRRAWVLGIAVAPLLLFGAFYAWIKAVETRRWADFEARAAELTERAKSRDLRRPVLHGEAVPGNAWTDYLAACDILSPKWPKDASDFLSMPPAGLRDGVDAELARDAAALPLLRAGTRRAEGGLPWGKGFDLTHYPVLKKAPKLGFLAMAQALRWSEQGKSREGAELLLDVALFGRDYAEFLPSAGLELAGPALRHLGDLVAGGRLPREAFPMLGRRLARLEEAFPPLGLGGALLTSVVLRRKADGQEPLRVSWRDAYCRRIHLANTYDVALHLFRRAGELDTKPWIEVERYNPALDVERPPGPKGWGDWVSLKDVLFSRRLLLARIRLLRLALGEAGPFPDPFVAGELRRTEGRFWSAGPDGVDNQGEGSWILDQPGDLVLELKKK